MPRKRKKPLKARILYAMASCYLFLLGCIFLLTTLFFAFWAVFIIPIILILGVRGYNFFEGLGDKALEAAGFGIKSLERLGAEIMVKKIKGVLNHLIKRELPTTLKLRDRHVYVDSNELEGIAATSFVTIPKYTRIQIKHTAKMPYIIEMQHKNKKLPKFFDRANYNEWIVKKKENIFSSPPRRIKIKLEDLPPTIIEKAKRIKKWKFF